MIKLCLSVLTLLFAMWGRVFAGETLPPSIAGKVPPTWEALWAGYDPRAEPLETQVLKEWGEDGVTLQVVRYRVGIFKGQKAMLAAVYGYPKGATNLPGLVQIHGGGQFADYRAVLANAKRGYATISIAWAGRLNAPGYVVDPDGVKLFWSGATNNAAYKLTTDWGALDAYHAPSRHDETSFLSLKPYAWTLDAVESPRNSPWFLCTMAARRALTFLEQQPAVNPDKLGVYGHSMGGKLTVLTTGADARVKAAAPSCGGVSDRDTGNALFDATVADDVSLKRIRCPIMFLSPANDFHGRINDLQRAMKEVATPEWRVTCSPHHNHQDTDEYEVATQLWFDQHLKGTFLFPKTPQSALELRTADHVPTLQVTPDAALPILGVDIYYTQQGREDGKQDDRENTMHRFWHHAAAIKQGNAWSAALPLHNVQKPLWAYANVTYALSKPVTAVGYYYGTFNTTNFVLSSPMAMVAPDTLKAEGARATLGDSLMIEDFAGDWEKEWFTYKPEEWSRSTHKIYDERWKAPSGAKLALAVRCAKPNKLVIGFDNHAAEVSVVGNMEWQDVVLTPGDFQNAAGLALTNWSGLKELKLAEQTTLRAKANGQEQTRKAGAAWRGTPPEFRNLRWRLD